MRITNAYAGRAGKGRARSVATIEWEDADRPAFEMTFEWDEDPPSGAPADSNSFLLASVVPAWRRGERRLFVHGSVCPRLRDGLRAAQQILSSWYAPDRKSIEIEPSSGFRPYDRRPDRAALFLTGGVDSLHMLRVNREMFPRDHPARFREAIYVSRLSFVEEVPGPRSLDLARRQARAVESICEETGLAFCRLESNFRLLDRENAMVAPQDQAALLAAVAHAISARVGSVSLAASHDFAYLPPWGTHPLLDPQYSSSGLEFRHEGIGHTRFEKLRAISDWETAHRYLVVCFEGPAPPGQLNCGECEKCLRTMTALLVLGQFERFRVFGSTGVTVEKLEKMNFGYHSEFFEWLWRPLVEPLERIGRRDLASAVRGQLAAVQRHRAWIEERDWRGRIRRFDRSHLGGALLTASRRIRGLPNTVSGVAPETAARPRIEDPDS